MSSQNGEVYSRNFLPWIRNALPGEVTRFSSLPEIKKFFTRLFIDKESCQVTLVGEGPEARDFLRPVYQDDELMGLTMKENEVSAQRILLSLGKEAFVFVMGPNPEKSFPFEVIELHRRNSDRKSVEGMGLNAFLEIQEKKAFAGKLVDFSDSGMALTAGWEGKTEPELLKIGTLVVQAHERFEFPVEIAHVSVMSTDSGKIGVRLLDSGNSRGFQKFVRWVDQTLFRKVSFARTEQDFSNVLKLVSQMPGPELSLSPKIFKDNLNSLRRGDLSVGEVLLYQEKKTPMATLSLTQVYSHTWLLHTFGIDQKMSFELPLELFERARDFLLLERGAKYLCGLWPKTYKALDRYYGEFVRKDYRPDVHHFETLKMVNFDVEAFRSKTNLGKQYEIEELQASDLSEVWLTIQERVSPVYLKATDLFAQDLKLEGIGSVYRSLGLSRSRKIFVARTGSKRVGFAIMEVGRNDQRMFGLTNSFRLFSVRQSPTDPQEVNAIRTRLINAVLEEYQFRGIPFCQMYSASEDWDGYRDIDGFKNEIPNVCFWICDHSRSKAFLRHLETVNWQLGIFKNTKRKIRPRELQTLEAAKSIFKPRQCVRLEKSKKIPGFRGSCRAAGKVFAIESVQSLNTFGASFVVSCVDGLEIGTKVVLHLENDAFDIETQAIVRRMDFPVSPGFLGVDHVIGVEFMGLRLDQMRLLKDFVHKMLNPEVLEFRKEHFASLGNLLERSDYFDYWEGTDHNILLNEAKETYFNLNAFPPGMIRTTLVKHKEKALASHSFFRVSPKTWQLHQLASDAEFGLYKEKLPTKLILQSSFQYLSLDSTAKYFLTWFSHGAGIAKAYIDAVGQHYDANDCLFESYDLVYLNTRNFKDASFQNSQRFGEANAQELEAIKDHLKVLVHPMVYDALSYDEPCLDWGDTPGEKRVRSVFVLRNENRKLSAFALADFAPKGANFLGILDMFQLFVVPGEEKTVSTDEFVGFLMAQYDQRRRANAFMVAPEGRGGDFTFREGKNFGSNYRLLVRRPAFMTALSFFSKRYGKLEERLKRKNVVKD